MMVLALSFVVFGVAGAIFEGIDPAIGLTEVVNDTKTKVNVDDSCKWKSCALEDQSFVHPSSVEWFTSMMHFDFAVSGNLTKSVSTTWWYQLTLHTLRIPKQRNTGVACGDTVAGTHADSMLFQMKFPNCSSQGGMTTMTGNIQIRPFIPRPLAVRLLVTDGASTIFDFTFDLGERTPDPPLNTNPAVQVAPAAQLGSAPEDASIDVMGHQMHAEMHARSCCDDCLISNLTFRYPTSYTGRVDFSASGSLPKSVGLLRYGFVAMMDVLGAVPLNILQGNGSACGIATADDGGEFTLEMGFPSCPIAEGPLDVWGHLRMVFPLQALGRIDLQLDIHDETDAHIGCALVTMSFRMINSDLVRPALLAI